MRGRAVSRSSLALHDHVLQAYGLLWLALMVIGLYA